MSRPVTSVLDASESAGEFISSESEPSASVEVASPQMPSIA